MCRSDDVYTFEHNLINNYQIYKYIGDELYSNIFYVYLIYCLFYIENSVNLQMTEKEVAFKTNLVLI